MGVPLERRTAAGDMLWQAEHAAGGAASCDHHTDCIQKVPANVLGQHERNFQPAPHHKLFFF